MITLVVDWPLGSLGIFRSGLVRAGQFLFFFTLCSPTCYKRNPAMQKKKKLLLAVTVKWAKITDLSKQSAAHDE